MDVANYAKLAAAAGGAVIAGLGLLKMFGPKMPAKLDLGIPGPDGYSKERPRRMASFIAMPEPPVIGETWKNMSVAQRVAVWSKATTSDLGLPGAVYVIYLGKMALYAATFWYGLRNKSESIFSDQNAKRFLVYNILGDVLGLNSTWGILGMRLKTPFVAAWNFVTPGTLCVPLVPGLPGKRGKVLVGMYLGYVGLLARALFAKELTWEHLAAPAAMMALILPQDLTLFLASRGEHFIYMLIGALFPRDQWIFSAQVTQLALWGYAGTSKLGPWFKYVTAGMVPNCVFWRYCPEFPMLLHKSPTDPSPSFFCWLLSHFGTVNEVGMCVAAALYPEVGVPLAIGFHCYIASMFPFASVMEWNMFCMWQAYFLFFHNRLSIPAVIDPKLKAFLAVTACIVPIFGQLFPRKVPFLVCYRPYSGNWRFSFHVIKKSAVAKLERLKTVDSPDFAKVGLEVDAGRNPEYAKQSEYSVLGTHMLYPHYRPFLPCIEEIQAMNKWGTDDFIIVQQEYMYNCIFGWSLATGFFTQPAYFEAVQDICKFDKGEYYTIVTEPCGLLDHTAEWWAVDVADYKKKVIHGSADYKDLEKYPVAGMPRSAINKHRYQ